MLPTTALRVPRLADRRDNGLMGVNRIIRVAVVEDQPLYQEMLVGVLGKTGHVEVVARASGAVAARDAITSAEVDVALLDVELADGNGVALGVQLRRSQPNIGIVLLSSHDVLGLLLDLPADVRRGWCYLSKTSSLTRQLLSDAIVAAAAGHTMIDPELVARSAPRAESSLAQLSGRQWEVLRLVAQGLSNIAIAERLELSPRSVENHLHTIYGVLGIPEDHNPRVSAVLRFVEESSRA